MKLLRLILIGEPIGDPSQAVNNDKAIRIAINPDRAKYGSLSQGLDEDNPLYQQAMRFSYPDLSNEDLYPDKGGVLIGSEQSKTLGSYPIFDTSVRIPSDIYAKRRAAMSEYLLKLEQSKSAPLVKTPPIPYVEGGTGIEGSINSAMVEGLQDIQNQATQQGISAYDAIDNSSNPYYSHVQGLINRGKAIGSVSKKLSENIANTNKEFLNSGTFISKGANDAIQRANDFFNLPDDQKKELILHGGNGGRYGVEHYLASLNQNIHDLPNLQSFADNYIKAIKDKATSEVQAMGSSGGISQWIVNKLQSQYPPETFKKDSSGNWVFDEDAKQKFLEMVARDIAIQKPSLFKDYDKDNPNPDAPFTLQQVKNMVSDQLGYEFLKTVKTATEPGAGNQNQVSAVPVYVQNRIEDIAKGVPFDIGKGTKVIPGSEFTTFIENGVTTSIPNANRPEIVKHLTEAGAREKAFAGDVTADEAWANIRSNKDVFNYFGKVGMGKDRTGISATGNQYEDFNSDIKKLYGSQGYPVFGGDISVKGATQAKKANPGDFYLDLKTSDNQSQKGVVIPMNLLQTTFENPNIISNILSGVGLPKSVTSFFEGSKKAYSPSADGKTMSIDGTYFHQEEPDKNNLVYYTVYDKKTDKPFLINNKEIKIPDTFVKGGLNAPASAIGQAGESYKTSEDRDFPDVTGTNITQNVATKTAKGKSASIPAGGNNTAPNPVANWILSNKRLFTGSNLSTIDDAANLAETLKNSTNPADKDTYNRILQQLNKK